MDIISIKRNSKRGELKMKIRTLVGGLALTLGLIISGSAYAAEGDTVRAIKKNGHVICGSDGKRPGFSAPDSKGVWQGFDVDFCRAVAAAILGDADKVKYVGLSPAQRFPALQSGDVDILSRVTTRTQTRDTKLGLNFAPITLYSGTKMMVNKSLGVKSGKELNGASICIPPGSSQERAISDFFDRNKISFKAVVIDNIGEIANAYLSGRCDAMASFEPGLALIRLKSNSPQDHIILPEDIEKEPLAPAVRHGDDNFFDIVTYTVFATMEAEERGINSANVDKMLGSIDPGIQRFLGKTGNLGENMGLPADWAYQIIKQVGNYEEIFERNIGKGTALGLSRGLNELWLNGGLHYSMPFQ